MHSNRRGCPVFRSGGKRGSKQQQRQPGSTHSTPLHSPRPVVSPSRPFTRHAVVPGRTDAGRTTGTGTRHDRTTETSQPNTGEGRGAHSGERHNDTERRSRAMGRVCIALCVCSVLFVLTCRVWMPRRRARVAVQRRQRAVQRRRYHRPLRPRRQVPVAHLGRRRDAKPLQCAQLTYLYGH